MLEQVEAWILRPGEKGGGPGCLERAKVTLRPCRDDEVLVEPLFACWEANMSHAILRNPVDICLARKEPYVVLGNAGVVRVLKPAMSDKSLKEGDICLLQGGGSRDSLGYYERVFGFDEPGSCGLLSRRTQVAARDLFPLGPTRFTYERWASFSVRYLTAWSNLNVALGALRLQASEAAVPRPLVCGWGGGTTLAELDLARRRGCETLMFSGSDAHISEIESLGVRAVDRRTFGDVRFHADKFKLDSTYRSEFLESEAKFLRLVREASNGRGADIFVDFLGGVLSRVTQKALAREGVITTAGWKLGTMTQLNRASECIQRHIHVHTHFARESEVGDAIRYGEANEWLAPSPRYMADWDDVPKVHDDFIAGIIPSYFPVVRVCT